MKILRNAAIPAAAAIVALTSACGGGSGDIDKSGKQRIAELEARGFQSVRLERAYDGSIHEPYAVANASVGQCRFRLQWTDKRGWQLTDDTDEIDEVPGELSAHSLRQTPAFRNCGGPAPTPSAPR